MSATGRSSPALESAKALRWLEPARLAVEHRKMLEDPLPAMDEAIREAEAKVRCYVPELN